MAGVCHLATDSGVCCPHRPVIALPGDPGPFLRALRCDALWQGQFQGMRPGLGATPPPVQAGGPRWGRAPRTLPGLPTCLQYPWAPGEGWGARLGPGAGWQRGGSESGYLCAPSSRAGGPGRAQDAEQDARLPPHGRRPAPPTWTTGRPPPRPCERGPAAASGADGRGTASSAHAGSAAKSTCQSSSASVRRSQDVSPPDCHCGGRAGRGRSTRPVPAPRTSWGRPAQLRGPMLGPEPPAAPGSAPGSAWPGAWRGALQRCTGRTGLPRGGARGDPDPALSWDTLPEGSLRGRLSVRVALVPTPQGRERRTGVRGGLSVSLVRLKGNWLCKEVFGGGLWPGP